MYNYNIFLQYQGNFEIEASSEQRASPRAPPVSQGLLFEAEGEGESFLAPKSFLPKKLLGPKLKSLQSVEISAGVDRPGYDAA